MTTPASPLAPTDERQTPYPPRYWWGKRLALALVLLFVALGVTYWIWGLMAQRRLTAEIAAIQGRGEPFWPRDFQPAPVDPRNNAAAKFHEAAAVITANTDDRAFLTKLKFFPLTPEELERAERILADNEAVVRLAFEARALTEVDWGVDYEQMTALSWVDIRYDKLRSVGWFLHAAALVRHQRGDEAGALACIDSLLRLAATVRKHPVHSSIWTSNAVESLANTAVMTIAPDLKIGSGATRASDEQIAALQRRFLDDQERRHDTQRVWYSERMYAMKVWDEEVANRLHLPFHDLDKARLLQCYSDTVRAAQETSWPAFKAQCPPELKSSETGALAEGIPHPMHDILSSSKSSNILPPPLLWSAVWGDFHFLADHRMAALALALRRYAANHADRLPDTLAELVPTYLPALPLSKAH